MLKKEKPTKGEVTRLAIEDAALELFMEQGYHGTGLQEILDVTADVDYNAELKQGPKYKVFVNPVYEKKSKDWKLAYRAGKQAVDAVRAAAQKWLGEIK